MAKGTLELLTEYQGILKRDIQLNSADVGRLDPTNAVPLEQGEFVAIDPASTRKGTTSTFTTNKALCYQVFTEKGRFDVQSISKVALLWGHPYEGSTNMFDASAALNGAIAFGDPLTVLANADGRLVLAKAANAGEIVYGYSRSVILVDTAALGTTKLQFIFVGPTRVI